MAGMQQYRSSWQHELRQKAVVLLNEFPMVLAGDISNITDQSFRKDNAAFLQLLGHTPGQPYPLICPIICEGWISATDFPLDGLFRTEIIAKVLITLQ